MLWKLRSGGGCNDRIERRLLFPSVRSVADANGDVIAIQPVQNFAGARGQHRHPFDGKDPVGQFGQDSRLVSRSRADFQNPLHPFQFQGLCHQRDDIGLGNRLPLSDGQRIVAVSLVNQPLIHEKVTRDRLHHFQNTFVTDGTTANLRFHHANALLFVPVHQTACIFFFLEGIR